MTLRMVLPPNSHAYNACTARRRARVRAVEKGG
jgi:hypothetical protein